MATLKASTGLRNAAVAALIAAIPDRVMLIFGDTPPVSGDAAQTGELLSIVSQNSTGDPLEFGTPVAGTIPKDPAQVWSGINVASGIATHFRIVSGTDTGAASSTEPRLQGTCGTAGANLNMSSVNLTAGAPQLVDAANITLPTP